MWSISISVCLPSCFPHTKLEHKCFHSPSFHFLKFVFFFQLFMFSSAWGHEGSIKHITCNIQKLGIIAGSSLTPRVSPARFPFLPELVFFSTEEILTAIFSKALTHVRCPYTTAAIFLNTETSLYQRTRLHLPACPWWAQTKSQASYHCWGFRVNKPKLLLSLLLEHGMRKARWQFFNHGWWREEKTTYQIAIFREERHIGLGHADWASQWP